jgi:hypothetical protein
MKMQQKGTEYGRKGESGERYPKGSSSEDTRGEKRVKTPMMDKEKFTSKSNVGSEKGESGESIPDTTQRDRESSKHESLVGGVGMGVKDGIGERSSSHMGKHDGRTGELNTGRHEGNVYDHKRG